MWFCIDFGTDHRRLDALTGRLLSLGHAASEVLEGPGQSLILRLYIEEGGGEAARDRAQVLLDGLGSLTTGAAEPRPVDELVWTENWKEHFEPLRVGQRLAILAPWHKPDGVAANRTVVVIDPGMAFGTGHHETTASCLRMVDRYTRPGTRVADIGCGSGVLAIAALKLGAARALAVDTDPLALRITRANAQANGVCEGLEVEGEGPAASWQKGPFDLVLANIVAETLARLAPRLAASLAPGGHMVLSGIESGRASLVKDAVGRAGPRLIGEHDRSCWTTLVMAAAGG